MAKHRIWVQTVDRSLCSSLEAPLAKLGLEVSAGQDPGGAAAAVVDSLGLAATLCASFPELPVILIRAASSEQLAIDAWRTGCRGYIRLECLREDLYGVLLPLLRAAEAESPKASPDLPQAGDPLVGDGPAMRVVRAWVLRVAAAPSNVLITGETGTGKELVAELIHRSSSRRLKPMICVNCAALPESLVESELFGYERGAFTGAIAAREGKVQQAHGGILFLDEIGDMDRAAQAKILRCLESRKVQRLGGRNETPVDLRIIAATNRSIEWLSSGSEFRSDLFYRLSVANIKLPPLRNRKEDLPDLCRRFIGEFNGKFGRQIQCVSSRTLRWMTSYDWPGNVRELRNVIEAAFINLPEHPVRELHLPQALEERLAGSTEAEAEAESGMLLRTLLATNWNKSKTARELNWSRMTLYRKMLKYRLSPRSDRTSAATSL